MRGEPLNIEEFVKLIATSDGGGQTPQLEMFDIPVGSGKLVVNSINSCPNGKSVGTDGVFAEALKEVPELAGEILTSIWQKCGKLGYMPKTWRIARLVPIYKKGDTSDPQNYRPISVISQLRKIIDGAIDVHLRSSYTLHPAQLGFRANVGVEHAVLRSTYLASIGMKHSAVPDLKKAYDTVPRDRLMNIVRSAVPTQTANMIAYLLQPMILTVENDGPKGTGGAQNSEVRIGVPQGDPPSTTLFNMYMDSLAEHVIGTADDYQVENGGLIMFADDVKLKAASAAYLQQMLDKSTEWRHLNGMTWSTPKCHVLRPSTGNAPSLKLAGAVPQDTEAVQYLGVTMTSELVIDTSTIKRCKSAHAQLEVLRRMGLAKPIVTAGRILDLCRAIVMPLVEYGLHWTPHTAAVQSQYEKLQGAVTRTTIEPFSKSCGSKARKVCKLTPHAYLAYILVGKLSGRLDASVERAQHTRKSLSIAERHRYALKIHREKHELPPLCTREALLNMWIAMCNGAARTIPAPQGTQVAPVLMIKDPGIRNRGISWYVNRFPSQNRKTRTEAHNEKRAQQDYQQAVASLRKNMRLCKWDSSQREAAIRAIRVVARVDALAVEASTGERVENGRAGCIPTTIVENQHSEQHQLQW